jgi:hypothetical protein
LLIDRPETSTAVQGGNSNASNGAPHVQDPPLAGTSDNCSDKRLPSLIHCPETRKIRLKSKKSHRIDTTGTEDGEDSESLLDGNTLHSVVNAQHRINGKYLTYPPILAIYLSYPL